MKKSTLENIGGVVAMLVLFVALAFAFVIGAEREAECAVLEQKAREVAREWYEDEYIPAKREGRIPRTQREWLAAKNEKGIR